MTRPPSGALVTGSLLLVLTGAGLVEAVLPTGELRLSGGGLAYAAPAWFGLQLPEEAEAEYLPLRVPTGDPDGCSDVTVADAPAEGFVLLVERGNCFFDVKALAAQEAGAKGLVVRNSVEGIYQVRSSFELCLVLSCVSCFTRSVGAETLRVLLSRPFWWIHTHSVACRIALVFLPSFLSVLEELSCCLVLL